MRAQTASAHFPGFGEGPDLVSGGARAEKRITSMARSIVPRRWSSSRLDFVPEYEAPTSAQTAALSAFVRRAEGRLLVITGAGLSTESGIPDYRSEKVGRYTTSTRRPMDLKTFLRSPEDRRRYWARSFVGFPAFAAHRPSRAHRLLADWERGGLLMGLVTQNVDGLHGAAGSRGVVELHGSLFRVRCLSASCGATFDRTDVQERLERLNEGWAGHSSGVAPDGDVDLRESDAASFQPLPCPVCASDLLQPDVVFFGDSVRPPVKKETEAMIARAKAVLAVGTSLQVFSAYRLVLKAKELGRRVGILNIGRTRADELADLVISTRAGAILPLCAAAEPTARLRDGTKAG